MHSAERSSEARCRSPGSVADGGQIDHPSRRSPEDASTPLSQPSGLEAPHGVVPRGLADTVLPVGQPWQIEWQTDEAQGCVEGEQSEIEEQVPQNEQYVAPEGL